MEGSGIRRGSDDEPRGFAPGARRGGPRAWRRVVTWLFADREDIDQRGLLADRTLFPRAARDRVPAGGEPAPEPAADDER
jgi:hypothetical protein